MSKTRQLQTARERARALDARAGLSDELLTRVRGGFAPEKPAIGIIVVKP